MANENTCLNGKDILSKLLKFVGVGHQPFVIYSISLYTIVTLCLMEDVDQRIYCAVRTSGILRP